jgi:hypothetical protein
MRFRLLHPEAMSIFKDGYNRWTPAGVVLRNEQLVPEVIASLIRMSDGNFRLSTRPLTQIERVLSVNDLHVISTAVVEAARDSLVIGPAKAEYDN